MLRAARYRMENIMMAAGRCSAIQLFASDTIETDQEIKGRLHL